MICKQCEYDDADFESGVCLRCWKQNERKKLQENARRDALEWAAKKVRDVADDIWSPLLIDEVNGLLHGLADEIERGEPPQ